jgi:hypothetical protein
MTFKKMDFLELNPKAHLIDDKDTLHCSNLRVMHGLFSCYILSNVISIIFRLKFTC